MELIKNIVANLELLWHEAYVSCQNLLISEKLAEFLELRDISAQRLSLTRNSVSAAPFDP
jgi:hypothetical protein